MNIAIFGGTFDPIHAGHLQAARTALRQFRLDKILFIPSGNPPHKTTNHLTPFAHRWSMVALACSGEPRFVPSLLEAPKPDGRHHYSIVTVRAVRRTLGRDDHLFFVVGIDAFLDLPHWKEHRRLLDLTDFIVVSRPGFPNHKIAEVVRRSLARPGAIYPDRDTIPLRKTTLHVLSGVDVPAASHQIRAAFADGRLAAGLVPPLVEEYIRKEGLYCPARTGKNR